MPPKRYFSRTGGEGRSAAFGTRDNTCCHEYALSFVFNGLRRLHIVSVFNSLHLVFALKQRLKSE